MAGWTRGRTYSALCTHVRDGDTIVVHISNPDPDMPRIAVIRLARIAAPELYPHPEPGAAAAQAALARLVSGKDLRVIPRRTWPDPYGRMIAEVYVEGCNISHVLIMGGFAVQYRPGRPRGRHVPHGVKRRSSGTPSAAQTSAAAPTQPPPPPIS